MSRLPKAVCISDIHFSLATLSLANEALRSAMCEAELLGVPLFILGDLINDKAVIRGEVANSLITLLKDSKVQVIILVGNHDMINEKGKDNSLNFLAPYATVVSSPVKYLGLHLIPYYSQREELEAYLATLPEHSTLLMHQGVSDAFMGDYIQDKSALSVSVLAKFKCISGHYHRHQTVGTLTYIGSPYTMSFGEANDGPKGFLVLYTDGSIERRILNLRKHIVFSYTYQELASVRELGEVAPEDLVWLKITGHLEELKSISKKELADRLFSGSMNFKLDLIPLETRLEVINKPSDPEQLLDKIIEDYTKDPQIRESLKEVWRGLLQ